MLGGTRKMAGEETSPGFLKKEIQEGEGDETSESIWSPDIEEAFQEALRIYPPCGRRKIITHDTGKMYGRNEMIAQYIKLRTGKVRTRKQVSSHIQVLERRKLRAMQAVNKFSHLGSQPRPQKTVDLRPTPILEDIVVPGISRGTTTPVSRLFADWNRLPITTAKLRQVQFSAFMEAENQKPHLFFHIGADTTYIDSPLELIDVRQIYDKFPATNGGLKELFDKGPRDAFFLVKVWADLNSSITNQVQAFYGVTTEYESEEVMTITCSTKVCSFGKQVLEKIEVVHGVFQDGRCFYRTHRSPMCEYMVKFINKLKHLPEKYNKNSVLENFTVLQVVINSKSKETLLCIAFFFEVSPLEQGAQHHIYKLINGAEEQ